MKVRIGLGLATALALLASGCGGGSKGPSASAYVHVVCTTVKTFETSVKKQSSTLSTAVTSSGGSADAIKKAASTYLAQAKADSDAASSALAKEGAPGISDGNKVQSTLVAAFSKLSADFAGDQKAIDALSTKDPTTFGQQLQKIGTSSGTQASSVGASLLKTTGSSSALNKAGDSDPVCKSLQ